jgi:hypothetical protein
MTLSETKLLNGTDIGSIVIANYHGLKRYGKVIEIDNDANRSAARGNVLVRHFNLEVSPETQWYWGFDVNALTSEEYEKQHLRLMAELNELNRARFAAKL